jgi:hypothetical protein
VRDAKHRTLYVTSMLVVVCMMSAQIGTFVVARKGLDRMPVLPSLSMLAAIASAVLVSIKGDRRVEALIGSAADPNLEAAG